ncbi:hypothetical protein [Nocardia sp. CDC160]|uniref:hypothetical protein n=1 Tax=Nocardia sp. CDC160 TaxID=3112166 RepID=UPI002DB9D5C9|nr:hypothetical protein [Nocardia sp. CDC160]MEC3917684.1 hypothetical protein [Nocardia sp. CDC160]
MVPETEQVALGWPRPRVTRIEPRGKLLRLVPGAIQVRYALAVHPRLISTLFALEGPLEFGQWALVSLRHRDLELAVLRANWNCGHFYHWSAHGAWAYVRGLASGHRPRWAAQLNEAIKIGPTAEFWDPRQAALLTAYDELHRDRAMSRESVRALREFGFSDKQLTEIAFVTGHYQLLGMMLESAGAPGEPLMRPLMGSPDDTWSPVPRIRRTPDRLPGTAAMWLPGDTVEIATHPMLAWALRVFDRALGRICSIDRDELAAALRGELGTGSRQAVLTRAVGELDTEYFLSDDTWIALREHYTEAQLLELCLFVGHSLTHVMLANTVRALRN